MKIRILSAAKTTQTFVKDGEAEFLKRLRPLARIEVIEFAVKSPASIPEAEVMLRESKKILEKLGERDYVVALDASGKELDSLGFSQFLADRANQGVDVAFVLGGAFGLGAEVKARAQLTLSLSKLTFPYQIARLLLVEQIYRGFTLIKGAPYHK